MPSSSNKLDEINGYVATNPEVKIFLLDAYFTSLLFSAIGMQDKKTCSCLKFALFVIKPFACKIPSTLFTQNSSSFKSSE